MPRNYHREAATNHCRSEAAGLSYDPTLRKVREHGKSLAFLDHRSGISVLNNILSYVQPPIFTLPRPRDILGGCHQQDPIRSCILSQESNHPSTSLKKWYFIWTSTLVFTNKFSSLHGMIKIVKVSIIWLQVIDKNVPLLKTQNSTLWRMLGLVQLPEPELKRNHIDERKIKSKFIISQFSQFWVDSGNIIAPQTWALRYEKPLHPTVVLLKILRLQTWDHVSSLL